MIRSAATLERDVSLSCDVVVIGTGAGGGMALAELAAAGLQVIAVEEGAHHPPRNFNQREDEMLAALFQDGGLRATVDGGIAVLQGRGVGGSTLHNTNLCKRIPDPVLEHWAGSFGLDDWRPPRLVADFEAVEERLHVSPIETAQVNRNNDVLRRGMAALGWRGGLLSHNRRGCFGSGFCELGCTFDAKENVAKILVPEAIARGAEVWSDCRVEHILHDGARVVGVEARGSPSGRRVHIHARAVVLAASAIGSPALALGSGLPDPHRLVGRNLHLHPGAAVAGLFDETIEGWIGIPQSVECTEHIDWLPGGPRRVWIVPAFAHPIGFATLVPGFGPSHMAWLRRYRNIAVLAAMVHDEGAGRVEAGPRGRPKITYRLAADDARALAAGLAACSELQFAAGAREVLPVDPSLTSVHPMGTLPMAADPRRGVVDGEGRWHGLAGLYVADGSIFPTSIGVPPQIAIYTVGRRVARAVVQDLR